MQINDVTLNFIKTYSEYAAHIVLVQNINHTKLLEDAKKYLQRTKINNSKAYEIKRARTNFTLLFGFLPSPASN